MYRMMSVYSVVSDEHINDTYRACIHELIDVSMHQENSNGWEKARCLIELEVLAEQMEVRLARLGGLEQKCNWPL